MKQTVAIVLALAVFAPAAQADWGKFVETTHNTIANPKCWEKAFTFGKAKGCE